MNWPIFTAMKCAVVLSCWCCPGTGLGQTAIPQAVDVPQQSGADVAGSTLAALASATELADALASGDEIIILEIGAKRESYDQGHVPGARYVDWIKDITDPHSPDRYNLLDLKSMTALMSRLGVANDSHIVVYDRFASRLSTRMYWTLKVWGHDRVQVLDGGWGAWSGNRSATTAVPDIVPTRYRVATEHKRLRADAQRVAKIVDTSSGYLIDGRPVEQFTGEKPGVVFHTGKPHQKSGHIPGAINVPWKDNLNADGTFKSAVELRALYADKGLTHGAMGEANRPVIAYCNEGLHAAMPWFVLGVILEFEDVSIYDDSMAQWANSERPVQKEPTGNHSGDSK